MNVVDNSLIYALLFDITKKIIIPKHNNLKDHEIYRKSNNDIVTVVDFEVEKILEKNLKKILPGSLFLGEESVEKNPQLMNIFEDNSYIWVVDPIDGTNNYVEGKNIFAVMIALSKRGKILQSWIYSPLKDVFCYSINNCGSFINDKKLNTNTIDELSKSSGSISKKYWENDYIDKIRDIKSKFLSVYGYGCIGHEYIDIAKGKREFIILSKLSQWDHMPGILLVQESGGTNQYIKGDKYNFVSNKSGLIVANNLNLCSKIIDFLKGE